MAKEAYGVPWCVKKSSCQVVSGGPASLLSLREASPGVLCPILGSPARERQDTTAESPGRATKMLRALEHLT